MGRRTVASSLPKLSSNSRPPLAAEAQLELEAALPGLDLAYAHVGLGGRTVGERLAARGQEVGMMFVVEVDDRASCSPHEGGLGLAVRLQAAVVVEMFRRQVGEDAGGVGDGVQAVEGEAMRARLEHHVAGAAAQETPQQGLHLRGLRRREVPLEGLECAVAYLDARRAQ